MSLQTLEMQNIGIGFAVCDFAVSILIINFATSNLQIDMDKENVDALNIRLKVFMDSTGLNNSQFADRCGLPRPSFSQLLSGRNKKVSDVVLTRIHDAFPQLNMLWLMFGEGDMLKADGAGLAAVSGGESGKGASGSSDSDIQGARGSGLGGGLFAAMGDGQYSPRPYPVSEEEGRLPFADENYGYDNRKFPTDGREGFGFHREKGPILPLSQTQEADIERISSLMAAKISGDLQQDLRKTPRKVVRITVFYDDNSYETFAPTSDPLD